MKKNCSQPTSSFSNQMESDDCFKINIHVAIINRNYEKVTCQNTHECTYIQKTCIQTYTHTTIHIHTMPTKTIFYSLENGNCKNLEIFCCFLQVKFSAALNWLLCSNRKNFTKQLSALVCKHSGVPVELCQCIINMDRSNKISFEKKCVQVPAVEINSYCFDEANTVLYDFLACSAPQLTTSNSAPLNS